MLFTMLPNDYNMLNINTSLNEHNYAKIITAFQKYDSVLKYFSQLDWYYYYSAALLCAEQKVQHYNNSSKKWRKPYKHDLKFFKEAGPLS